MGVRFFIMAYNTNIMGIRDVARGVRFNSTVDGFNIMPVRFIIMAVRYNITWMSATFNEIN